ncbi:MaoC family dehydratase [Archaeoglobus neptunius]|uniref:MaoC family dehydratase n=1 Tax=Archaeoglobus neptunius TaxID=2798580 RepID=UPI001926663E|nr:MaoC family dehydratase [Archaeoglobus neptunius]
MEEVVELYRKNGGEVKDFRKFDGTPDIGYRIQYEKKICEVDVQMFGLVSGDLNPVHFDDGVASKTKFGGRVAHGMLTTSLVSAAVARMPGLIVLLETHFRYTAPVRVGDTVRVVGEVVEKENNRYRLDVKCYAGEKVVVEGWVTVLSW